MIASSDMLYLEPELLLLFRFFFFFFFLSFFLLCFLSRSSNEAPMATLFAILSISLRSSTATEAAWTGSCVLTPVKDLTAAGTILAGAILARAGGGVGGLWLDWNDSKQ